MPITINGNGTITGLVEGGIEDAKIINADIKDDTIEESKLNIHADPSGTDKYLKYTSNGMEWVTVSTDPTTTSGTNSFTVADGDLVIGTAGHGVDFSANTQSAVSGTSLGSELLDWYEEGTFTPTIEDWGGEDATQATYGSENSGKYTRIGNVVFINMMANQSSNSASAGNRAGFYIGGLPFTQDTTTFGSGWCITTEGVTADGDHQAMVGVQQANSQKFRVYNRDYDSNTSSWPDLPTGSVHLHATFHYRCT